MPKYLRKWILLAAALCLLLTGCGQDTSSNETPPASSSSSQETQQPAGEETAPEEAPDKTPAEAPDAQAPEEDAGEQTYTDNFSVDPAAVQAFAQDIQQVVADQDLEGLADLVSFPIYLGFADDPQSVETREDFVALGADRICSPRSAQRTPARWNPAGQALHCPQADVPTLSSVSQTAIWPLWGSTTDGISPGKTALAAWRAPFLSPEGCRAVSPAMMQK